MPPSEIKTANDAVNISYFTPLRTQQIAENGKSKDIAMIFA